MDNYYYAVIGTEKASVSDRRTFAQAKRLELFYGDFTKEELLWEFVERVQGSGSFSDEDNGACVAEIDYILRSKTELDVGVWDGELKAEIERVN